MFVRLKSPNGDNTTLVASKIAGFYEGREIQREKPGQAADVENPEVESMTVTTVVIDGGDVFYVVESERVIRSKIEKALAGTGSED